MQTARDQYRLIILAGAIIILAAFVQCFIVSHDLRWFYDLDVSRDMAYVQQILYGRFGRDPNFANEYIWYNPLMTLIQAAVIKLSGLPIHTVIVRLGTYANLLAPISFFIMMLVLFKRCIALAGLLSFLFFAAGQIPGFYAATYSPWMYPGVFMQFVFYINIALCYKAFETQKAAWFVALGTGIGVSIMGHAAPTILIILILISLQAGRTINAIRQKDGSALKEIVIQSVMIFLPFAIISLPFTYYIVGKYHLHFLNRKPFEYVDTIFIWRNYKDMILQNLSVSLFIAIIGFFWFYKNFKQPLIRKILIDWLILGLVMYFYSTLVASLDEHKIFRLPVTVPSFHYFFYLKALQSVFYGFGLYFIARTMSDYFFKGNYSFDVTDRRFTRLFIISVLLCGLIYFPFYQKRYDFVHFRSLCLEKEKDTAQIQVYYYILDHIPADKVFLTEESTSLFPVMATARKMVSIGITFSNIYVDFWARERARNDMLSYLQKGQPSAARGLFKQYGVNYILLTNVNFPGFQNLHAITDSVCFRNDKYTILNIMNEER
jgi:hypothetical protein